MIECLEVENSQQVGQADHIDNMHADLDGISQSFVFLVSTISTVVSLLAMIILQPVLGFNYIPAGSFAITGAMWVAMQVCAGNDIQADLSVSCDEITAHTSICGLCKLKSCSS